MKIAAAYIRVSTDDQLEYSPDSQIKLIRDFAKKNNYILPEDFIFIDEGISGKTAQKRPEFNRMVAIAKQKEDSFDVILVWKFSRFARNQEESIVYKKMLKKSGVDVVSISEPIADDAFGSLIERIIEWMDEYYVIRLSDEVKRGMTEKATRGEPNCRPAFGYYMKDKNYYQNPQEAPIVKEVFSRFISGETMSSITIWLQSIGVRTMRGNPPDRRFVEYMLHNPVYCGKIRWCPSGRAASKRDYYNEDNIIVNGTHEPIISEEMFEQAEKLLAENRLKYRKFQRSDQPVEFMLKGMLRCGNCGATLVFTNKTANSVQCHNYSNRRGCTVSHNISLKKADSLVISALKHSCETLDFNLEPTEKNTNENATNILSLIEKEKQKLIKIKESYTAGIDTLEEYAEQKEKINQTIATLKKELPTEKPKVISLEDFKNKVLEVLKTLEAPDATPKSKNEALRTVVSKIIYNKNDTTNSLNLFFYA